MLSKEEHRRAMQSLCIVHITDAAHNRMLARNAGERQAAKLMLDQREQDQTIPDTDDEGSSSLRNNMLS